MLENGNKYGELTVTGDGGRFEQPSGQSQAGSLCRCECGNEKRVRDQHLKSGRVTTCGHNLHGLSGSPVHTSWRAMRNRVREGYSEAHLYYARCIGMCEEWKDFKVFLLWAIENGFKRGLQLDRINNDKGYSPRNCRFVTPTVNANNKRVTVMVTVNGVEKPFMDHVRDFGLECSSSAVRGRIKRGWSHTDAFAVPIRDGDYARGPKQEAVYVNGLLIS